LKKSIKLSGFCLAKGDELKGDDRYEIDISDDVAIAILCDGVGSAHRGAEAADRVCNFLKKSLKNRPRSWSIEKSFRHFIESINKILYQESMDSYERTELITTVAVVLIESNRLYGANVGDSRIYMQRQESLTQLSVDHVSDDEGFEGVLEQAVGIAPTLKIHYFENILKQDDIVLLCSDGLYAVLDEQQIYSGVQVGARHLVKSASAKLKDNLPDDTTAVVVKIGSVSKKQTLKSQKLDIPEQLHQDQVVDGYRLKKPLIQNNRTWLCEKKDREYVIKFAPFEAIDDERTLDLFVEEAWNAARLKAGFFPKAVIPKKRSFRYYIMENLKGDQLYSHITQRALLVDEGVSLARFLLKMAQHLLSYDLVHGDIKPENIIRAQRAGKTYYKIVDFGSIVEIFSISSRAGTPSYLAPERFENSNINEQSEIFAIGVTLYEALTSKLPYGEIEPFQTPNFKPPKRVTHYNKNIPLWLDSIISRAITSELDLRYKNYSEMLYDLEHPEKVKPFYDKSRPLIQNNPLLFFKIGFFVMLASNLALLTMLFK